MAAITINTNKAIRSHGRDHIILNMPCRDCRQLLKPTLAIEPSDAQRSPRRPTPPQACPAGGSQARSVRASPAPQPLTQPKSLVWGSMLDTELAHSRPASAPRMGCDVDSGQVQSGWTVRAQQLARRRWQVNGQGEEEGNQEEQGAASDGCGFSRRKAASARSPSPAATPTAPHVPTVCQPRPELAATRVG